MKGIIKTANGYRIIARVRVNGKIVQRRKTVQCTKEDAKALHEQLKTQIRSGKSDLCSLTLPLKLYKHLVAVYREKKAADFLTRMKIKLEGLKKSMGT